MRIPIYQLDAFAGRVFTGNPAAVCPLEAWLPDALMQAIAAENNLSETAFFVPDGTDYALRWFTPTTEVDLCGHATLAAAEVVFRFLQPRLQRVQFHTRQAGTLAVWREGEGLAMDLPARPPVKVAPSLELAEALGAVPAEVLAARDYLAIFARANDVKALSPDFRKLAALDGFAVIATAPGEDNADFVSRFFAPKQGVDEDPVTGSAHCTLTPYWAARLGKKTLKARQISARGGELLCADKGERVVIGGKVTLYLEGSIDI